MAKNVIDRDLGLKAFVRELGNAKHAFVTVGIHEGERSSEGTDIAEYGAANEYGTKDIPSRPFMRTSFDENVADIQRHMEAGYAQVQTGGSVFRALSLVGLRFQNQMQHTIKSRNFLPKLAEATIKRKGDAKTLIDKGAMVNSIRYVVHT